MKTAPLNTDQLQAVVFDADGVLVHGKTPHPGAIELLNYIRDSGRKVYVLTNNSSISRSSYASRWRARGFRICSSEVITSGFLTACYFRDALKKQPFAQFAERTPEVFVVGGVGIGAEFKRLKVDASLTRDYRSETPASFVIAGIDRTLSYAKIARAQKAILYEGALFIATNRDPTFPTETRFMPGAGVSVASIATAVNREPDVVIGKPNRLAMEIALKIAGCSPAQALMVGDRLDTDIEVASKAGVQSVLVMSGSTTPEQLRDNGDPNRAPDLVIDDVNGLRDWF